MRRLVPHQDFSESSHQQERPHQMQLLNLKCLSLQSHELDNLSIFYKLHSLRYFVIATEKELRQTYSLIHR
jgi:hypothetical protein